MLTFSVPISPFYFISDQKNNIYLFCQMVKIEIIIRREGKAGSGVCRYSLGVCMSEIQSRLCHLFAERHWPKHFSTVVLTLYFNILELSFLINNGAMTIIKFNV